MGRSARTSSASASAGRSTASRCARGSRSHAWARSCRTATRCSSRCATTRCSRPSSRRSSTTRWRWAGPRSWPRAARRRGWPGRPARGSSSRPRTARSWRTRSGASRRTRATPRASPGPAAAPPAGWLARGSSTGWTACCGWLLAEAVRVDGEDPMHRSPASVPFRLVRRRQSEPAGRQGPDGLTAPPGHPRFPAFDGLRAIAAVSVLVVHTAGDAGTMYRPGTAGALLAHLDVGVTIFFLISGFLLYRPFSAARLSNRPRPSPRRHRAPRVLRIVPAYWLALTVLAIYPGLPRMFSNDWWIYYGFLQTYDADTINTGIGQAWTLGVELSFYAMLPLYAAALDRLWRRRAV